MSTMQTTAIAPGELRGAFARIGLAETYTHEGVIKVKDSFPICPSFGAVWYREVDLGFPDVRASIQEYPEADGTLDSTKFIGARNVAITGVILNDAFGQVPETEGWPTNVHWNSASWFGTLLSSWASPSRRYRLYFADERGRSRFMDVRGDSFTLSADRNGGEYREFQLGMVAPVGKIYSFCESGDMSVDGRRTVRILTQPADVAGRSYVTTYPRSYPTVSGTGDSEIYYTGSVPHGCTIEIFTGSSTLTAPRITVLDPTGVSQSIGLSTAYTIPANTVVTFDTVNRLVTMREVFGSTTTSLERYLAAPLQWPQLKPGLNPLAVDERARQPGYNRITYSQGGGAPAADLTITVKYYTADLH